MITASTASRKLADRELGDLVQAQLRERRLDHDDRDADPERLREQERDRQRATSSRRRVPASPQGTSSTSARITYRISCFIDEPQRSSAEARGPSARACGPPRSSRTRASPPWFSNGTRPVSASTTMKNAAAASRCAGRTISAADDFNVAANTYGRSVCVISATVKTTNRIVGSPSAPNVRSRLDPSWA